MGERKATELRRRGERSGAQDEEVADARRPPARPGTPETGRPSREALGAMDRDDLKRTTSGSRPEPRQTGEEDPDAGEGPAHSERGRRDRREFSGHEAEHQ